MSRAFRKYENAETNWRRAAHICIGLLALFAIVRWFAR